MKFDLIIILSGLACCQGIFRGTEENNIENVPYMVLLSLTDVMKEEHRCGGSIVDEYNVLTTAQCLQNILSVRIRIGSVNVAKGGKVYTSSQENFVSHFLFDNETLAHDIGLIRVPDGLDLKTTDAKAVTLSEDYVPEVDELVKVSGWGGRGDAIFQITHPDLLISRKLYSASMPVVELSRCKGLYREYYTDTNYSITEQQFCAGADRGADSTRRNHVSNTCQGDTGGPAVLENSNIQVGIISHSFGCSNGFLPAIFTKITEYNSWIQSQKYSPVDTNDEYSKIVLDESKNNRK